MKKQVFLFELDSVRKTDDEIIVGQKTLYDEIVRNGNIVVLTYNQLIDSRAFFSLLNNKNYYDSFIKLFELGVIKVSQYGRIRTLTQYLLNTIDSENNKFLYSALPLKRSQRRLIALIRRSLIYSDLSEIQEYIELGNEIKKQADSKQNNEKLEQKEENLKDLFVEIESCKDDKTGKVTEKEIKTKLTLNKKLQILNNLHWLLSTVFRLSTVDNIFVQPRNPGEYKGYKLTDYLTYIAKVPVTNDTLKDFPLWERAMEVLQTLPSWKDKDQNNRSQYLRDIKAAVKEDKNAEEDKERIKVYQFAEAIVNICTNYAYEMSICNISKHYNPRDVKVPSEKFFFFVDMDPSETSSFFIDFRARLKQHWKNSKGAEKRFLVEETNEFEVFKEINSIPDFAEAARIIGAVKRHEKVDNTTGMDNDGNLCRYEYNLEEQRSRQKESVKTEFKAKLGSLLFVFMLALAFNLILELIHKWWSNEMDSVMTWGSFLNFGFETVLFLAVGEFLTTVLSKKYPGFIPLSETAAGVVNVIRAAYHIFFMKNTGSQHVTLQNKDVKEKSNQSKPIDVSLSVSLQKYVSLYKKYNDPDRKEENKIQDEFSELMIPAGDYPIADVNDDKELKRVVRSQELYRQRFGVVYSSSYNTMLVDPIKNGSNNNENKEDGKKAFYSYERVIPSAGVGVVLLTMRGDRFVLIRQYRHAIRREQLCFPRGYGEKEISEVENAKKELLEELGAVVSASDEPRKLGMIAADSGLSSGTAAVYLMKIDGYKNTADEGIREVVELSRAELADMIKNREIDDGYTLAAYSLYVCSGGE